MPRVKPGKTALNTRRATALSNIKKHIAKEHASDAKDSTKLAAHNREIEKLSSSIV
jgi:hypothetical protein